MPEQALIQFSIDKKLKQEVSEIYESLGMDLSTALKMFMVRSKIAKGLPFPAVIPDDLITHEEALSAFKDLRKQATDVPDMTPDEINAEISASRAERKARK